MLLAWLKRQDIQGIVLVVHAGIGSSLTLNCINRSDTNSPLLPIDLHYKRYICQTVDRTSITATQK